MKRRLGILLLITFHLLCGSLAVTGEKVQLTFMHNNKNVQVEWANIIIERFEKLHPDIEVNLITTSTGAGYQEKIAVLTAAGSAPDVFTGFADKLGFIVRGFAMDITELAARDAAELEIDTFFPGVWEAPVYNGRLYGIPLQITTQFLFYNKDLLQSTGLPLLPFDWDDGTWTWERFLDYCRRLTVHSADGKFSRLAVTQANTTSLPDLTWMFGGDWFEPEAYITGIAERVTLTRPENIAAFNAMVHLYANYAAAGPNKGIAAWPGFSQGRIAMDWVGAWRLDAIMELQKQGTLSFDVAIAPPPLVLNRANTRYTNPLFISTAGKHKEEAWEFVKFATSQESQKLWAQMTRTMPARRTVAQEYIQGLRDVYAMTLDQIATAITGSIAHSRRSIEEAVFDLPLEINRRTKDWLDPIITGAVPVESGLASLENSLNVHAKELREKLGL
ncbi:MAG TPA: sugar ABC transporter substrate-binding protein [Firmicutes bacterium]|jgi:multiple sugar transport system substrate-binding protein|nr:sugar ABC transporter substrate-binding protein [Bacillota bacterium]